MAQIQNIPFLYWSSWWAANPHIISLASGAFAGVAAEVVLFPLDCCKTKVQSHAGIGIAPFRGIYRGVGTAMMGAAPASAIFFSTYEFSKSTLGGFGERFGEQRSTSGFWHCVVVAAASVMGELAACSVRVPVDLAKQRLQAGQVENFRHAVEVVRTTDSSVFLASFRATAVRDTMHSSLQYPMYEFLKLGAAHWSGCGTPDGLRTWQAAVCGSIAGSISAVVTTPLDLVKTRINLREQSLAAGSDRTLPAPEKKAQALFRADPSGLLTLEAREIYRTGGLPGFFTGAMYRAAWMGLGGFVFLGSFEFAKDHLSRRAKAHQDRPQVARHLPTEQPAFFTFSAGLVAGLFVDIPLHPVDTIKTRLQSRQGIHAAGGFRGLWSGLSAVLATSVPGSAIFFVIYEKTRYEVERQVPGFLYGPAYELWRDAASASVADVGACLVRVPCEVLKQRMQTTTSWGDGSPLRLLHTMRSVSREGPLGFYAGFGATVCREVPFALIQMPVFEELKRRHPWRTEGGDSSSLSGAIGMTSGGLAGAIAGALTTPLDAAKTRIMLTQEKHLRKGLLMTISAIHAENGFRGLMAGLAPRTIYCSIGGAMWLGAFEVANSFMRLATASLALR